jgi:hypothetical protein
MSAPTEIPYWATEEGGEIIASLVPVSATFIETKIIGGVTYGLIDYAFSGSPDLSDALIGHRLTVNGFLLNANNGSGLWIEGVYPDAFKIRVRTTARTDTTLNESGITGTGSVTTIGANKTPPAPQKQAQGAIPGEKPGAGTENWYRNLVGQWISYFAAGGAMVLRTGLSAWRAITRSTEGAELIHGQGFYRFNPDATDTPGEGFLEPDTGAGLGIIESAHPDAMAAMLAAFVPEILPPVSGALTFGGGAATINVPGVVASASPCVQLGPPGSFTGQATGRVSSDGVVTIQTSGGSPDGLWSVTVTQPNSMPVITTRGLKIFVNLIGGVYDSTSLETDLGITDNEAAFNLLVNSRQHRAALLDGGTIEEIISGSATADAIIEATGGY